MTKDQKIIRAKVFQRYAHLSKPVNRREAADGPFKTAHPPHIHGRTRWRFDHRRVMSMARQRRFLGFAA